MKRRDFIKRIPAIGAASIFLDGILCKSMSEAAPLQKLAALCPNDRVLIILQMHGGNDGLNMVIPASDYDRYYNARPNIAISDTGSKKFITLDSTLPSFQQAGLHPSMTGIKSLYDVGKVRIVQGVSYENPNGSHFRSRDIMFMGGGGNDFLTSGWVGRYLQNHYLPGQYPDDFPNSGMEDPLALEFGNDVSLIFHQNDNIPASISINNPQNFFDLINELPGFDDIEGIDPRGYPPEGLLNSRYGKELQYLLSLEDKTDQYDDRILNVYNQGKIYDTGITYPTTYPYIAPKGQLNNPLTAPLKIIANLLSGGCKTKVFLIKIGGFDTHAGQVETSDHSSGVHAALLYHISESMKAFQDDLEARNLEDRVLTITTSEFGRRVYSNGSTGTDHGIGAPVMLFGKGVNPGLSGQNPDLSKDDVEMQFDYRQLYATILKEWLCIDPSAVDQEFGIIWGDYQGKGEILPLINNNAVGIRDFINQRFQIVSCYPNPATFTTTISFHLNGAKHVQITIKTTEGKLVKDVLNERLSMGTHQIVADLRNIPQGLYTMELKAGPLQETKKLVIAR